MKLDGAGSRPLVADTLGLDRIFIEPLWRIEVALTPVERELLRTWWVRRLGFVAHAGAAAISTTQSYTRLEHSLGLLALVSHFSADDETVRVAALLHDIGHLPFSHTFEGLAGIDHHRLGAERIADLAPILRRHGIDSDVVVELANGTKPSVLHGATQAMQLDHLESFVRSGRSHGRTREPPPRTLARLRLADGAVDTDRETADYLIDLVIGEALSQTAPPNVVATAVLRHLAGRLLSQLSTDEAAGARDIAELTDHDLWSLLLTHPSTAADAATLRRDPAAWMIAPTGAAPAVHDIDFQLRRLYLDLPLVGGEPVSPDRSRFAEVPVVPRRWSVRRRES